MSPVEPSFIVQGDITARLTLSQIPLHGTVFYIYILYEIPTSGNRTSKYKFALSIKSCCESVHACKKGYFFLFSQLDIIYSHT